MLRAKHQYVDRESGEVRDECLIGDRSVRMLYSVVRENTPLLFRSLTSGLASSFLAFLLYDSRLDVLRARPFLSDSIDFSECVENPSSYSTPRRVFQRQIRYWHCRPMEPVAHAVVSPADSRVLVGSFKEVSALFLKEKFFDVEELLGESKPRWSAAFQEGDFAIFRLTPEKYHYNHTPVAGTVIDIYEVPGAHHSCNPGAVIAMMTPFAKNKRVVTIIDTDVDGGSHVGLVAMIEIVALMIGDIVQCYSEERYENPQPVTRGMFLRKGVPKSLYRPGSSTDVLLFQRERIAFAQDILENQRRLNVQSRFSLGFGRPLVETDVKVRSSIATAQSEKPEEEDRCGADGIHGPPQPIRSTGSP